MERTTPVKAARAPTAAVAPTASRRRAAATSSPGRSALPQACEALDRGDRRELRDRIRSAKNRKRVSFHRDPSIDSSDRLSASVSGCASAIRRRARALCRRTRTVTGAIPRTAAACVGDKPSHAISSSSSRSVSRIPASAAPSVGCSSAGGSSATDGLGSGQAPPQPQSAGLAAPVGAEHPGRHADQPWQRISGYVLEPAPTHRKDVGDDIVGDRCLCPTHDVRLHGRCVTGIDQLEALTRAHRQIMASSRSSVTARFADGLPRPLLAEQLVDQGAAPRPGVVQERGVAPGHDLEVRVGDQRCGPPADLRAAVGVLVSPDHEHGRRDVLKLGVGEEVLRTGTSKAHGEPHVAQHRRTEARLPHALMDDLEEPFGRELGRAGPDRAVGQRIGGLQRHSASRSARPGDARRAWRGR